ncbi:MAG: hypothetical protein Q8R22_12450 [Flavobacterium sp.]|jgi:hypothetical protein|uniref:hypothetical protein n=1 Tax=Flavobacterium sp. TaxID=239 RepID=UPI0027346C02|nr:hypothetical protein [Flavobacterium sp.]MDP3681635.1 hypothetical protein [Flavobacterium sp.]
MNKYLTFIIFFSLVLKANCQTKCNCEALIDIEYKKEITLLEKPNGKIIKKLKHDFKNEDFLTLTIEKDSLGYFKVSLLYLVSAKEFKGWVKKNDHIGTFARNYEPNKKLNLYSESNVNSKVKSTIEDWTNDLYIIEKCAGKWVYVKIKYNGKIFEGWLKPEMQCANPYTTCN